MPKLIDIEELTGVMDASLAKCRETRETSFISRAMLEVVRPGHLWRARERNRGSSAQDIVEGLCEITTHLLTSELEDIDADDDAKLDLINAFLQAVAEGVVKQLGTVPTAHVFEREVGTA